MMDAFWMTWALQAGRVAHLAIDLQKYYCDPEIVAAMAPDFAGAARRGQAMAAKVGAFADRMRPYAETVWVYQDCEDASGLLNVPRAGDITVGKSGYDAFDLTGLYTKLADRGKSVAILSGVFKDKCVLSTALHARDLGMEVVVLDDLGLWSPDANKSGMEYGFDLRMKRHTRTLMQRHGVGTMRSADILAMLPGGGMA